MRHDEVRILTGTDSRSEDHIGGTFHYRSYENAELVSSKQLTTFSDFRLPRDSPDHISLPEYVRYLERYCTKFDLWRHIKLKSRVTQIDSIEDGKWAHRVRYCTEAEDGYQTGQEYECSHIAVCTGLHVKANIPFIPGIDNFRGQAYHSSQYKGRSQLSGKNVLILGCGETAMDIAYESIKADAQAVTMCFRTGFLSFPKVLNRFRVFGKTTGGSLPIDGLITNLFETAYVHHAVAKSRMRWFVSDAVLKRVIWFLTGTQAGCNQYVGELPRDRLGRAYVFLNKSNKAMPYLVSSGDHLEEISLTFYASRTDRIKPETQSWISLVTNTSILRRTPIRNGGSTHALFRHRLRRRVV